MGFARDLLSFESNDNPRCLLRGRSPRYGLLEGRRFRRFFRVWGRLKG
ncbi:hypothetical protein NEISICOT_02531 [Neisseria sicca ATCC 29256]|uniref:Uncharacterized protein n=1 Tax=Neisseria sicca ATCC 29256 TaxID=547045 RepID=C6M7M2_NEISI|nr:hypothetical protein NEISICOT_02531 [Neisseria sicca ATCC 29256]